MAPICSVYGGGDAGSHALREGFVGDGSKVENRDGSKVNWDNLHGKMSEDVGPYKIGRFFKDPEF
jgi:hypothetical protein